MRRFLGILLVFTLVHGAKAQEVFEKDGHIGFRQAVVCKHFEHIRALKRAFTRSYESGWIRLSIERGRLKGYQSTSVDALEQGICVLYRSVYGRHIQTLRTGKSGIVRVVGAKVNQSGVYAVHAYEAAKSVVYAFPLAEDAPVYPGDSRAYDVPTYRTETYFAER